MSQNPALTDARAAAAAAGAPAHAIPEGPFAAPTSEDRDPSARGRLESMLEETVLPSPNSVDLHRTAERDYLLRFSARAPHIAELFQENTKLTPHSAFHQAVDEQQLEIARRWFLSTAYRVEPGTLIPGREGVMAPPLQSLPDPLPEVLGLFSGYGRSSALLYANDLLVLHRGRLLRVVPESDTLWVERQLSGDEIEMFRSSLLRLPDGAAESAQAFLIVAAAPWRYMMFLGPRGYRHVMFEAGSLVERLEFGATQSGLTARRCFDFYDARIDRVLQFDGVERTALAVVLLEGDTL